MGEPGQPEKHWNLLPSDAQSLLVAQVFEQAFWVAEHPASLNVASPMHERPVLQSELLEHDAPALPLAEVDTQADEKASSSPAKKSTRPNCLGMRQSPCQLGGKHTLPVVPASTKLALAEQVPARSQERQKLQSVAVWQVTAQ